MNLPIEKHRYKFRMRIINGKLQGKLPIRIDDGYLHKEFTIIIIHSN